MKTTITTIWAAKLNAARTARPMTTILLVLLVNVGVSALLFLVLLTRVSWEDADWWLKAISAEFASVVFLTGLLALYTGGVVNDMLKQRVADTQADAARANERAENEALARVELEKQLARREIPFIRVGDKTNLDGLRPFGGMQVIIEYLPDFEASRAAWGLSQALTGAGWKVVSQSPNPELATPFWDGVVVQAYWPRRVFGLTPEQEEAIDKDRARSYEAAKALVGFLKAHDWAAREFPSDPKEVPPNTVKIKVGFKPPPRLTTKFEEEFLKATGQEPKPLPQQRQEPRHFTPAQRDQFLGHFSEPPPWWLAENMVPVQILCPAGNDEACAFAEEIADLLRGAKWPIVGNAVVRENRFPRRQEGIMVKVRWGNQFMASGVLLNAFGKAGIKAERETDLVSSHEPMQMLVGW